ncbi:MAG: TIGR03862 family flavoprotein [Pseudomonadota bacterium]
MPNAIVIGAGPAGLMAAQVMAEAGLAVRVVDQKPSVARKFLMAGKSGLNLTKNEKDDDFLRAYGKDARWLAPMIEAFGVAEVMDWAEGMGQEIFTGSTGRVFPKAMKASPLLRAWLAHLNDLEVEIETRHRWIGWDGDALAFDTPSGSVTARPDVCVFALGGGSWARLGSDGRWTTAFGESDIPVSPFAPSNTGLRITWSEHMGRHFGVPVKNIALRAGDLRSRGEIVVTSSGIEGGGVYPLTPALRVGTEMCVDLLPDLSEAALSKRLSRPRGKMSMGTYLRKTLKLDPVKIGLLNEMLRPMPKGAELAAKIKSLPLPVDGLMPLDQAISTTGGVLRQAVNGDLMLNAQPGSFVAGEMLDWDAPTGGYLITACLATGAWAGKAAARYALR